MRFSVIPIGFFILCAMVLTIGFQNCSLQGAPDNTEEVVSQASVNCASTEIAYQGVCHAQYIPCSLSSGSGQQEFNNGTYGSCVLAVCAAGFHSENSLCVSNKKSCTLANGSGEQSWNGTAYDACVALTCNAEYVLAGGTCAGPAQVVQRYKTAQGLNPPFIYDWSLLLNDPAPVALGYAYEAPAFKLFKTANAQAQIPLYRCRALLFIYSFIDQAATCSGFNGGVLLGYASAAVHADGQSKPLYTCGKVIVANTADCAGQAATIYGYSF